MGNNVHILGEQSGLHIVLHVHNGMNEQELIHAAARQRIKLYPLSTYDSVHNVREESYVFSVLVVFQRIVSKPLSNY